MRARASDAAGNASANSALLNVTIDTTPPAISTPDLTAGSDSGSSSTDDITRITTPAFSGTADAGLTVQLLEGDTVLGSTVATGGNWTITSSTLAAGVHTVFARATDVAGNLGTSSSFSFTIDTTAPAAPTVPDLTDASDTGVSNIDNLTNLATPSFSGTSEPGATITLLEGATVRGTATADGSGNWTVTSNALTAGSHSISAPRPTLPAMLAATSAALTISIDLTAPAVSAPDLLAASDSGTSSTDNITNITTPIFTGTAEAGATVTLLEGSTVLGTTTASGSGSWSITSSALASESHNISARATDAAGKPVPLPVRWR